MRYGLYDTKDHLWLGGTDGPKTWGEGDPLPNGVMTDDVARIFARVAAETIPHTVGWDLGRVEVREYPGGPVTLRDSIHKIMEEAEVLKRKERGSLL